MSAENSEMVYLNDDCIMEIVKRLDVGSLCAFRKTSTKLRRMAIESFNRKHSDTLLEICEDDDGVKVYSNNDYCKCFWQYIENVYVLKWPLENEAYSQVGHFMQTNIVDLKQLVIRRMNFNDHFGIHIAQLLQSVESVSIVNTDNQYQDECAVFSENILKHCQQLKRLTIHSPSVLKYLSTRKFVTLEYFDFIFYEKGDVHHDDTTIEYLKDFFYLNPNIKELKWQFIQCPQYFLNDELKEHIASCLKSFMDCAKHLDVLYLDIPIYLDATIIFDALLKINRCKNIDKIEIKLMQLNGLPALTKLTGLYVSHYIDGNVEHTFNNLKILKFYRQPMDAVTLTKKVPNLEELYIYEHRNIRQPLQAEKGLFMTFVRYLPKLKKIVTDSMIGDDGLLFNYERQNLKDACELDIYMCATRDNNYANEYTTCYSWIESSLVRFKLVRYEDFYDADFANVKNQMYPIYKKYFYNLK